MTLDSHYGGKGPTPHARGDDLRIRTREFALRIIRLVKSLPKENTAIVIGRQLLRAGTSVGANYRAACRAKSARDFVAKMTWVEEEADECGYWLDLLTSSGVLTRRQTSALAQEADELVAIVVASTRTTKRGINRKGA